MLRTDRTTLTISATKSGATQSRELKQDRCARSEVTRDTIVVGTYPYVPKGRF